MIRRARRRRLFPAGLAAFACLAATHVARAHKPVTSRYSFSEHVLPVLERRCLACHRPGGPGPMSLAAYEDARPWAEAMKDAVLERSMPPWFAEPGFAHLAGENALTAREIDAIAEWASGGAPARQAGDSHVPPQGTGKRPAANESAAPPATAAEGAGGAREEMTVALEEVAVAAPGSSSRSLRVPLALDRDRYLAGWSIAPGNPALLRAAALSVVLPPSAAAQAGQGVSVPAGTWLASEQTFDWPPGAGLKVPRGSSLAIDLVHGQGFRSAGKEIRVRSALRLRFLRDPPAREVRISWFGTGLVDLPGAEAIACFPGASGSGTLVLREKDAPARVLLDVFGAARVWPLCYRFASPVPLAAEARLEWVPQPGAPDAGRTALFYSVPRT